MSIRQRFRNLLLVCTIAIVLMVGIPIRPDQIEELLSQVNAPRITHVLKKSDKDEAPDPPA